MPLSERIDPEVERGVQRAISAVLEIVRGWGVCGKNSA
jgi:hypothetical protein